MESKIVTAVGIAVSTGSRGRAMAKRIENAMRQAVLDANAEGISTEEKNSDVIRERMMLARRKVLDEIAAENEAALKTAMEDTERIQESVRTAKDA